MKRSIAVLSAAVSIAFALSTGCALPGGEKKPAGQKVLDQPRLPGVPPVKATPIDLELQQRANAEIAVAFKSNESVTRAQAIEALSRTNDRVAAKERALTALRDKDWIVRFAGAMCAGDLKLTEAYQSLLALVSDQEPSVRVAVRYALHRLGDKTRSKDLEPLSQHPDPRVRGNVAVVIGLLKEPTGTRVVRPLLGDLDAGVRMQAAEALWRLGDEQGLRNLVAGTISPFPDEQIVCVLGLAGPRDQRVKEYITGKLAQDKDNSQYVELQLAAARALGMLGSDAGFGVAVAKAESGDPRQRVLAAFALGDIGRLDGQPLLAKLLTDGSADVRLAAAVAVRQIGNKAMGQIAG